MNMKTTDEMSTGKKKKNRQEIETEFDIEDEEEYEDVKPKEDYTIIPAPRYFEGDINVGDITEAKKPETERQKPDTAGRKQDNVNVDFSSLEEARNTIEELTKQFLEGKIPESKYRVLIYGVNSATKILSLKKNMELDARIKALEKEFSSE